VKTEKIASGALAGKLIIDLSRVLGGPYCTQILGDHGAEVVKIEPPRGDETRDWGPPNYGEDSAYFIGVNRNKRSMGLGLSVAAGRDVLFTSAGERRCSDRKLQTRYHGKVGAWL